MFIGSTTLSFAICYVDSLVLLTLPLSLVISPVVQVDVGDFLRFKSCVLYTEYHSADQPLINIEVVAHVTRPELRSSEVISYKRVWKIK